MRGGKIPRLGKSQHPSESAQLQSDPERGRQPRRERPKSRRDRKARLSAQAVHYAAHDQIADGIGGQEGGGQIP